MNELKLYQLLLGSRAPGRHVEQHDFFFAIGTSLKDLVPEIRKFWREAAGNLHIDGWRQVNAVDGFRITVAEGQAQAQQSSRLFFINLGGYTAGKFEEQHYTLLSVQPDRAAALKEARRAAFFKTNSIAGVNGANAHIDDKYGIDVDDIYEIKDMLSPSQKERYHLLISTDSSLPEDEVHLGYFRLDKLG